MAERKLTPREKQLKREDPERFALLMANRTKRKGSMKTGLTKFSKDKTFKPTKKKKKVKRNQRIGGGTLFSKLSKDSVTDSAEKREDKVRPKRAKPVVAIKPSVLKDSKKRGSMKPGLDKVKKIAKEREDKVNRNLTLGKKVIPTPIPKAMTMKKKPVSPKKKRSPIAKSDTRYLNDYRIEKTAADDNYDPRESLFGAMFSGNQTPEDKVVRNPFTGNDMMLSYDFPEDTEDMKKGGSIKKKMKKGKVRKRAALRGQGKALRGF
tara:strand:+ start:62 stop:853 length:792 start_codon:yes stop_codon:yes gene_type:complete